MFRKPKAIHRSTRPPDKIKHLTLKVPRSAEVEEYVPRLYFEARIDLSDVRSGFRDTYSLNKALEIHPMEGDVMWTPDMAVAVDTSLVELGLPPGEKSRELPDYVDAAQLSRLETLFLAYLMRYFEVRVFRNFALNVYSGPGESLEDFKLRCLDILGEAFRRDLDALHEVLVRKLEQLREKDLRESAGLSSTLDFDIAKIDSQVKSRMHEVSESITNLFLNTELSLNSNQDAPSYPSRTTEFDQRLSLLETETRHEIQRLTGVYHDRLQNIDEYLVHPNLKDIHLVRTCILWMPAEAVS
jgi:hypothetical protein